MSNLVNRLLNNLVIGDICANGTSAEGANTGNILVKDTSTSNSYSDSAYIRNAYLRGAIVRVFCVRIAWASDTCAKDIYAENVFSAVGAYIKSLSPEDIHTEVAYKKSAYIKGAW